MVQVMREMFVTRGVSGKKHSNAGDARYLTGLPFGKKLRKLQNINDYLLKKYVCRKRARPDKLSTRPGPFLGTEFHDTAISAFSCSRGPAQPLSKTIERKKMRQRSERINRDRPSYIHITRNCITKWAEPDLHSLRP